MASGIDADFQALDDFITNFPNVDELEGYLTRTFAVTPIDFTTKVNDFHDGLWFSSDYNDRITKFNTSAATLVKEMRSLLVTVKWIRDQYENAKNEDVVSATDVDRQFNSGLNGTTG